MSVTDYCLIMIVRDEAPIITRALDSMSHFLKNGKGAMYIHDTGSVDDTQEIIQNWADKNGVFCDCSSRIWENFGANKTELIQCAQKHTDVRISKARYYVWLDADEVWVTNPGDSLSYPTPDAVTAFTNCIDSISDTDIFMIQTYYGNLQYRRWNACRNNQPYKWEHPVHEFFVGEKNNNTIFVSEVSLIARKEGNSSRDPSRYQKDALMFLELLAVNPDDSRAQFYLAQTYESFDMEETRHWYAKRIDNEHGWNQERYISCLRLGRYCTDIAEKRKWWLRGTDICPERLECWYELMMLAYVKGDNRGSVGWGTMAPDSRTIDNTWLFVEFEIYRWQMDLHLGVSCFYVENHLTEGERYTRRALESGNNLSESTKQLLLSNLRFYEEKKKLSLSFSLSPPRQEIIIIENFYENPDTVRADALTAEYPIIGNFPGRRSKQFLYPGIKEKFESIIGRPIQYWPDGYNGAFQWVTGDMSSWIHRDCTEWSAIVFLTPGAPCDGGTKLYQHKVSGVSYSDHALEEVLNRDSTNEDAWHIVDTVGNIYNRCVLFRGKRSHKSDRYFGDSLENARLFQTFFFND